MTDILRANPTPWITKLWGQEHWIVNTDAYCGKILHLHAGFQCSLHMHPVKDETFYVVGGIVHLWLGTTPEAALTSDRIELGVGDSVRIPPTTWHRFGSHVGATIAEFSTHHDDADVVRAEGHESGALPW